MTLAFIAVSIVQLPRIIKEVRIAQLKLLRVSGESVAEGMGSLGADNTLEKAYKSDKPRNLHRND